MESYIINFITHNILFLENAGYYFVFLSGFIESLPVIGFIIPGQTIVMLGGFLAKKNALCFLYVFLFATMGAIIGDIISFLLGRYYGEAILRDHGSKFFIKESLINETKQLVLSHPGKTLLFGRLNSVTRSLAPFIAGTSQINVSIFLFYCITGGIIWGATFVTLGFILGKSFEVAAPIIGKFILIATLLVGVIIFLVQFMKKKGLTLSHYNIQMLVTNIVSLYTFASLAQGIKQNSSILYSLDLKTFASLKKIHGQFLDTFMISLSKINSLNFLFCFILLCIILIYYKKIKDVISLSITTSLTFLTIYSAKIFFNRPRPLISLISETGQSFPSGHATASTLFFLMLIHIFTYKIKNTILRFAFVTLNILTILLVSFSRIYLGVHYMSDVIAGIALGAWIFSFSILASKCTPWFYKKIKREQIMPNL